MKADVLAHDGALYSIMRVSVEAHRVHNDIQFNRKLSGRISNKLDYH